MLKRLPKTTVPLAGLALLTGLYWLYWSSIADRLRAEVTAWAQAEAAAGIYITWSDMRVRGWPLRLRLEFDDLRYDAAASDTPWVLETPAFRAHALPYRLTHVIASAKSPMQLTVGTGAGQQRWEITADRAQASYVFANDTPPRLAVDMERARAHRGDGGAHTAAQEVTAERVQLHARKTRDTSGSAEIAVRGAGISLSQTLAPGLVNLMGPTVAHIGAQARVTAAAGDAVFEDLALLALEGSTIEVSESTVTWGATKISAHGKIAIAASGASNGRFDTTVQGYDAIIAGLARQGLITNNMEASLTTAMAVLSFTTGGKEGAVRVPVIIRDSAVYLGPVRITQGARTAQGAQDG